MRRRVLLSRQARDLFNDFEFEETGNWGDCPRMAGATRYSRG